MCNPSLCIWRTRASKNLSLSLQQSKELLISFLEMYKGDATKQGVCYACQYLGCSSQRWLQSTGEKLVLILAALRRPSWPSGGGCEVRQTENCNAALECWCANLWSASRVCLAPASLTHESESTRYLPRSHEEGKTNVSSHRKTHSILMKILVGHFVAKTYLTTFIHCKWFFFFFCSSFFSWSFNFC